MYDDIAREERMDSVREVDAKSAYEFACSEAEKLGIKGARELSISELDNCLNVLSFMRTTHPIEKP